MPPKPRRSADPVRTAPTPSNRYVACPSCGEWLDRSDLAELVRHAETKHTPLTRQ